jgi:hypothetical protein
LDSWFSVIVSHGIGHRVKVEVKVEVKVKVKVKGKKCCSRGVPAGNVECFLINLKFEMLNLKY